ncbi:MAG: D-aminoacyl-tRNA deacylase [Oscillospiraceae bacterium]
MLLAKTAALRIFCDENGKMNRSICDINGEMLVISQFTLCADVKKGNRPSFTGSMGTDKANGLYLLYCEELRKNGTKALKREFSARICRCH